MISTTTSTLSTAFVTFFSVLLVGFALVGDVRAATADDWRGRAIYQLFTDRFARTDQSTTAACNTADKKYCGGSFQGIIQKLDYIQGMGFSAIWISPVITNINSSGVPGEAYHGFWSQDITTINQHFGTEDDLKALSKALHDRDMLLMIDVVANNFASVGTPAQVVYSSFDPFNKQEYFHSPCAIADYSNYTDAQECWLAIDTVSLPDMDTESSFVQSTWNSWGSNMVSTYGIDGMRIDAAKHVERPFWHSFQSAVNVFMIGEVYDNTTIQVCSYMENALTSILNYPMWFSMNATFTDSTKPMTDISDEYLLISNDCRDLTLAGSFTDNQDVPRMASWTSDMALLKNTMAYTIMADGIPIVYYGAEQAFNGSSDPTNREALWLTGYPTDSPLYTHVATLNMARNQIKKLATFTYWNPYWTFKTKIIQSRHEILVMRKGYDRSIVTIVTNQGSSAPEMGPYTIADTNFNEGDTIVEILACTSAVVGQYGVFNVTMPAGGLPMVWMPAQYLTNTTICPSVVSKAPPPSTGPVSQGSSIMSPVSSKALSALVTLALTALVVL